MATLNMVETTRERWCTMGTEKISNTYGLRLIADAIDKDLHILSPARFIHGERSARARRSLAAKWHERSGPLN